MNKEESFKYCFAFTMDIKSISIEHKGAFNYKLVWLTSTII